MGEYWSTYLTTNKYAGGELLMLMGTEAGMARYNMAGPEPMQRGRWPQ